MKIYSYPFLVKITVLYLTFLYCDFDFGVILKHFCFTGSSSKQHPRAFKRSASTDPDVGVTNIAVTEDINKEFASKKNG